MSTAEQVTAAAKPILARVIACADKLDVTKDAQRWLSSYQRSTENKKRCELAMLACSAVITVSVIVGADSAHSTLWLCWLTLWLGAAAISTCSVALFKLLAVYSYSRFANYRDEAHALLGSVLGRFVVDQVRSEIAAPFAQLAEANGSALDFDLMRVEEVLFYVLRAYAGYDPNSKITQRYDDVVFSYATINYLVAQGHGKIVERDLIAVLSDERGTMMLEKVETAYRGYMAKQNEQRYANSFAPLIATTVSMIAGVTAERALRRIER